MNCKLRHPYGQSLLDASPRSPNTWLWQVGSCIRRLLSKGGSEGPCLGEVPRHKKKNKKIRYAKVLN
jgi:hypothetical protein